MLYACIAGAQLLIASSAIAGPISPSSFDASTEVIEAGVALEARAKPAVKITADSLSGDATEAVRASVEVASSIAMDVAANRSSDFTSGSKSQDSVIVKRWGKNSFMDCTDKYDCVAECGMGTKACWKTCKGDPSYPDCDTYRAMRLEKWRQEHGH